MSGEAAGEGGRTGACGAITCRAVRAGGSGIHERGAPRREAERRGHDPGIVWDLLVWLLVGGIVGARLWHILPPMPESIAAGVTTHFYLTHPRAAVAIWNGGLGISGGVIGGLVAMYIFVHRRKLSFGEWTDISAPGLALGQGIGRWGNFFNQELYGLPTNLPWKIYIDPQHRMPGDEVLVRGFWSSGTVGGARFPYARELRCRWRATSFTTRTFVAWMQAGPGPRPSGGVAAAWSPWGRARRWSVRSAERGSSTPMEPPCCRGSWMPTATRFSRRSGEGSRVSLRPG